MAEYLGKKLTKADLLRRIGHMSQVAPIRRYEMQEGKAEGLKVIEVSNGGALAFTVLESKALDISNFGYKGVNFNFVTKPGLVAPQFYSPHNQEFPRNFHAGMVYTCGLLNVGPPCVDEGMEVTQHGRIGQTPAEKVSVEADWEGEEYRIKISGETREAANFRENMVLKREISTCFGSKTLSIHDVVENQGFERQPLMIMYHCNLGYPLLDAGSRFVFAEREVRPRDEVSEKGVDSLTEFSVPIDHWIEQVFYHTVKCDDRGYSVAGLVNDRLGLGLAIKFDTKNLPRLLEWKSMMSGDYVLGIEPSNCVVDSRVAERERGTLRFIDPFETVDFHLELEVLDGKAEIAEFERQVQGLRR
jgi:hypothetical protein